MVRRAVILMVVLLVIALSAGAYCDVRQMQTAQAFLSLVSPMRDMIEANQLTNAQTEERYVSALWLHEQNWLKCLVSHHHIREVDAALRHLRTALAGSWPKEALLAMDELEDALLDIRDDHLPTWVNIL